MMATRATFFFFAAGQQGFVGGFDVRAALDGDQGGHEEGEAQVAIARAADVAGGVGSATLTRPRIEFVNAGCAAQALHLHSETGLASRELGGRLLQGFDPLLEVFEVGVEIGGDDAAVVRSKRDGVEAGLMLAAARTLRAACGSLSHSA